MSSHNQLTAPLDARTERHHLAVHHLLPRLLGRCVAKVRIGLGIAMTRKMLDAARDTSIFQSLQIVRHHGCCHGRVVAEGTSTDDDVLGIGVHVGHRCKVDVEAIALQIGAYGVATFVGVLWVAGGTDGCHRLVLLHVEVRVVGNACHSSSLLVDAEQGRAVQGANVGDDAC